MQIKYAYASPAAGFQSRPRCLQSAKADSGDDDVKPKYFQLTEINPPFSAGACQMTLVGLARKAPIFDFDRHQS